MTATVCRHCMGPFMAMRNSDPMGSIWARGDAFAKAASTPRKPIVVVGVWMLFGPLALGCLVMCGIGIGEMIAKEDLRGLIVMPVPVGGLALFGTILYRTTNNFFKQREASEESEKD